MAPALLPLSNIASISPKHPHFGASISPANPLKSSIFTFDSLSLSSNSSFRFRFRFSLAPSLLFSRLPLGIQPRFSSLSIQNAAVSTDSDSGKVVRNYGSRRVCFIADITEPKRVVLVRHGESTWNAAGRIQGSSNFSELTAKGINQAEISKQMLQSDHFDICFYSPLKRASQTAKIIWASRSNPMVPIDDLREIDLYSFQGLMKEEGKQKFGDRYKMWQKDSSNFEIDNHYPVRELWERAMNCWNIIFSYDKNNNCDPNIVTTDNVDGNLDGPVDHPNVDPKPVVEFVNNDDSIVKKHSNGKLKSILVVAHNAVNQALVATAIGLDPVYFRKLLQSNCGISVIDFFPKKEIKFSPYIYLDRLNQTPNPPLGFGQAGRKPKQRIILVCDGTTDSLAQGRFQDSNTEPLNILGLIQSRKSAELLLDVKCEKLFCSSYLSAVKTAESISEMQEGAECLGADCIPRYVEIIKFSHLDNFLWGFQNGEKRVEVFPGGRWQNFVHTSFAGKEEQIMQVWERVGLAWGRILDDIRTISTEEAGNTKVDGLTQPNDGELNVVVVSHDIILAAMVSHCLGLPPDCIGNFNFNPGSISVLEFPDGPWGSGVVRCLNYTSHLGRWAIPITKPSLAEDDF